MDEPSWLTLSRELQAIAQTGLTFTKDAYDRQRFERVRELAAILMAEGAGDDTERVLERFRQEVGYLTPKVDVRGAAFADGRILLVRERSDGGWADVNQSSAECAVREIADRDTIRGIRPQSTSSSSSANSPAVRRAQASRRRRSGSSSAALPPLSGGRVTPAQIEAMFEHAAQPLLPTAFD